MRSRARRALRALLSIALLAATVLSASGACRAANGGPVGDDAPAAAVLAITSVSVLPMDRDTILPDHTVIVRNGRIAVVGPAAGVAVPAEAARIDGRGLFLMPGLVDMHVHLLGEEARGDLPVYLANGVTMVRNMSGEPRHVRWRRDIERGSLAGPTLVTSGPFVERVDGDAGAARLVREHQAAGYDFAKVRVGLSPDQYAALARAARAAGLPLVGHAPIGVPLEAVAGAGQRTLDHAESLMQAFFDERQPDASAIPRVGDAIRASGACVVPTLTVFDLVIRQTEQYPHTRALLARPEMQYVGPELRASWQPHRNPYVTRWRTTEAELPEALTRFRQQFHFMRRLTTALHEAGVPLLAGTDAGAAMVVPGFSLRDELRLLHEAGVRPFDVLRAATLNAALCMDRAGEFGVVAAGARADLVLYDRNPLTAVADLPQPSGVVVRGRWLPRDALRALLVPR
ncbi:MAG TPA: amidohydrolase family protein [Vicinamibacterales bacterium]|nr:amidohydrolase family protein [Vicinamibacterales bacterium]